MQKLFNLFEKIGKPYYRQGSMSDEDYKEEFFTFWNINSPSLQIRDNATRTYVEYVQIGAYTNNARNVYSLMDSFIAEAKAAGFIVEGKAHDANADKPNYYGRIVYIKIINKMED